MGSELTAKPVVGLVEHKTAGGTRLVSVVGWRNEFARAHLLEHLTSDNPRHLWCETGHLATAMYGRNTQNNRRGVRRALTRFIGWMLAQGQFVVVDYDSSAHGQAKACTIFDPTRAGALERQYAERQVLRMEQRKELSVEKVEAAKQILGIL